MQEIPCPLCKTEACFDVYQWPLAKSKTENQWLVQCVKCSHTYVNPVTPQEYKDVPIEIFDCDLQPNSESRFDFFYQQFMTYYGKKQGLMLEIGCGMGHFIRKAKKEGWEVIGMEPSLAVAKWARERHNIDIVPDYYLNTPTHPAHYDAICAIEVLEHTSEPRLILERMHRELKTGGLAYLTVPNFATMRLKADKTKSKWHEWPAMVPFGHLQFFTPGHLLNLCLESGFKVVTQTVQTGDHDDEQIVAACYKL